MDEPRLKKTHTFAQSSLSCMRSQSRSFLFSYEFCEICKKHLFYGNLRATASVTIEMQVKIMTYK